MTEYSFQVVGFGACMISGFPYSSPESFYDIGLRKAASENLIFESKAVVSLPAFGIDRAEKYLSKKIKGKSQIVVLQFASTDAACPLNNKRQSVSRSATDEEFRRTIGAASKFLRLKWFVIACLSFLVRPKSNTSLEIYGAALTRMLNEFEADGVFVIVVGPFVCGNHYSTKSSKKFSLKIEEIVSKFNGASFVNGYKLLKSEPLEQVVLSDGFHISRHAHAVIGAALAESLRKAALFLNKSK